jgi:expansin (peptidoglycan-binding protein)
MVVLAGMVLSLGCRNGGDSGQDTDTETDSASADGDADSDADSDSDSDGDADGGDEDAGADADSDADSDGDSDAEQDTGSEIEPDPGPDDCYYDGETFEGLTASREMEGAGNCRLDTTEYYATVSGSLYNEADACGRCVHVRNPATGVTVDAMVVDRCPDDAEDWCRAESDDISLNDAAFAALGGTGDSTLETEWYYIPCEGSTFDTIAYRFEGGTNPFWFAVQVRNQRNPIESVEVQGDSGWVAAGRQDYNYWVIESGMGEGPFTIRVKDIFGNTLRDENIPLTKDQDLPGQAQFPACENADTDTGTDADQDTDTDSDLNVDTATGEDVTVIPEPDDCNYNGQLFEASTSLFDKIDEGACRLETGDYQATVSSSVYDGANACGRCVRVVNLQTGDSVDAAVHEQCPSGSGEWCNGSDLSLNAAAFEAIGGEGDEALRTAWYYIPCEGEGYGVIKYRFEGGANPFWFAVEIRDHRNAVQSVEVNCNDTWTAAVRQDYNYWVIESGCGEGPFSIRVKDIYGNELTDDNIPLTVNQDLPGSGQFPTCAL